MIKKIFIFTTLLFPLASFASPSVSLNNPTCQAIDNGNLTACFKNSIGSQPNYNLMETVISDKGNINVSTFNLAGMSRHFYATISAKSDDLAKEHTTYWYSIIKDDASSYSVMPGCTVSVSADRVSSAVITIKQNKNGLYCQ